MMTLLTSGTQCPIVFMFSGQGGQYYQMGLTLFNHEPIFKEALLKLDSIAKKFLNESIIDIMYNMSNDSSAVFDRTLHTHPAIYLIEVALAETLLSKGIKPDYVLSTSMGSFAAATIAGCMTVEDALDALVTQAVLLERHCQPGCMLAVLDSPSTYSENTDLYSNTWFVGSNFNHHFVIAGDKNVLGKVEKGLFEKDISCQMLAVSQAFHSPLIDEVDEVYSEFLSKKTIDIPKVPWVCSMYSNVLVQLSPKYFWDVVRKPICFQETIKFLEAKRSYRYVDIGPSGTLATFVKYNLNDESQSSAYPIVTPYGKEMENLDRILSLKI